MASLELPDSGIMPNYFPQTADMMGTTGDWRNILSQPFLTTVQHNAKVFNRAENVKARWASSINAMAGW